MRKLKPGRWHRADGLERAAIAEPVHPFQPGELRVLEGALFFQGGGAAGVDGLVGAGYCRGAYSRPKASRAEGSQSLGKLPCSGHRSKVQISGSAPVEMLLLRALAGNRLNSQISCSILSFPENSQHLVDAQYSGRASSPTSIDWPA